MSHVHLLATDDIIHIPAPNFELRYAFREGYNGTYGVNDALFRLSQYPKNLTATKKRAL